MWLCSGWGLGSNQAPSRGSRARSQRPQPRRQSPEWQDACLARFNRAACLYPLERQGCTLPATHTGTGYLHGSTQQQGALPARLPHLRHQYSSKWFQGAPAQGGSTVLGDQRMLCWQTSLQGVATQNQVVSRRSVTVLPVLPYTLFNCPSKSNISLKGFKTLRKSPYLGDGVFLYQAHALMLAVSSTYKKKKREKGVRTKHGSPCHSSQSEAADSSKGCPRALHATLQLKGCRQLFPTAPLSPHATQGSCCITSGSPDVR